MRMSCCEIVFAIKCIPGKIFSREVVFLFLLHFRRDNGICSASASHLRKDLLSLIYCFCDAGCT